jgi:hypothetical protein
MSTDPIIREGDEVYVVALKPKIESICHGQFYYVKGVAEIACEQINKNYGHPGIEPDNFGGITFKVFKARLTIEEE